MADYVTIANMAASLIGEDDQISAPDDDKHVARSIKAVWDLCRRAAIRDHSWNCFMARDGLSAESLPSVPYPWGYSFPLPADCVRLIEVLNIDEGRYQLEGRSILCDSVGPVYVRYLKDIKETALWDDLFAVVMSRRVAYQVGARIAGSSYDRSAGWQLYLDGIAQAKRADARENPQVAQQWTEWEMARFGSGRMPMP